LNKKQRITLELVVKSGVTKNFYLAGGTALTIKYGHRISEDFDFFLYPDKKIDFLKLLSKIEGMAKDVSLEVEELTKDTLIFYLDGIKFSFFEYSYPLLRPASTMSIGNNCIMIASDPDISAMKAIAIIQRGEKKDFYDLWFLMQKNKWGINDICNFCKHKYQRLFPVRTFLKSIVYFEDAERSKIPDIEPYWEEVKDLFKREIKQLFEHYMKDVTN